MNRTPDAPRLVFAQPVAAALLGIALAWALAAPAQPEFTAIVRTAADGLGAVVLGLAALPWLLAGTVRHWELPWRLLALLAASWSLAELSLLMDAAAGSAGVPAARLSVDAFASYLGTGSGQVSAAAAVCTLVISGYALSGFRLADPAWSASPALVLAAATVALRPIIGHMSQQPLGSLLGAIHALTAAAWCGLLAALAITLRGRAQWSAALPRYSRLALPLVTVLTLTGVCNAVVRLGGLSPFLTTGYGRIAMAKFLIVAAALMLGWWWRRTWVRQAARHQVGAAGSLRRAIAETSLLAAAFGLAASLAVTA